MPFPEVDILAFRAIGLRLFTLYFGVLTFAAKYWWLRRSYPSGARSNLVASLLITVTDWALVAGAPIGLLIVMTLETWTLSQYPYRLLPPVWIRFVLLSAMLTAAADLLILRAVLRRPADPLKAYLHLFCLSLASILLAGLASSIYVRSVPIVADGRVFVGLAR